METADQPGVMRACADATPADVLMGAGLPALKAHNIVSTLAIQSVAYLEEAVRHGSVKALLGGTTNMDDHVLRFIRLAKRLHRLRRLLIRPGWGSTGVCCLGGTYDSLSPARPPRRVVRRHGRASSKAVRNS